MAQFIDVLRQIGQAVTREMGFFLQKETPKAFATGEGQPRFYAEAKILSSLSSVKIALSRNFTWVQGRLRFFRSADRHAARPKTAAVSTGHN
jgi:hypothetical protein